MMIEKSFDALAQAIDSHQTISMNRKGVWRKENWVVRFIFWLFDLEEANLRKISGIIAVHFCRLENMPLFFHADRITTANQHQRFQGYLKVANALAERLKKANSPRSIAASDLLKKGIVALNYRMTSENGGIDKAGDTEIAAEQVEKLEELVGEWKQRNRLFQGEDKNLHPVDLANIRKTCQYPQFVDLLIKDPLMQKEFFSWVFKNCNPPSAFIEYPGIAKRLSGCLLSGRIGRFAYENVLSIDRKKISKKLKLKAQVKVLRLPFNGKKVSILDETKLVAFRGKHIASIKTVFEVMKKKNDDPGDYEFIGKDGFQNWNSHKLAYWDEEKREWIRPDLSKNRWWEQLPDFEILSKEALTHRYALKEDIRNDQWLLVACASRQSPKENIDDCHGYIEPLIPTGDGKWRLYSWGKFAHKFPQNCFQKLGIIGSTVKAAYVYPDPNPSYSGFRQQAAVPFIVSEELGMRYMEERIKGNILKAWSGNLIFMYGYENCAYEPQTDLEAILGKEHEGGRVPNLYMTPFLSAGASQPVESIFRGLKSCPKWLQSGILKVAEWAICSWRTQTIVDNNGKKVKKSLSRSAFRKGVEIAINGKVQKVFQYIYLPSHLHRQIIQGTLQGVIWTGHQHVQQAAEH